MSPEETQTYYKNNKGARWSALVLVCMGAFLTPLALSAVVVAIPAIAIELNANAVMVSWIPAAFLVANLVTLLPSGRLSDQYGRKRMFFIGSIIFTLASLMAGLSSSIELLLLFRVFQGMGAAMYFGSSMAIVSSVFRSGGLGMAMGFVVSSVYFGLTLGPIFGGVITEALGWRYVFILMTPLSLLSTLLIVWKLKGEWRNANPPAMDWVGAVLFALWAFLLFYSISHLPQPVAFIALGIDVLVFLVFLRHTRHSPSPLVNFSVVWQNKVFSRSLVSALFVYGGNYGLIFLLSVYLQISRGMSPADAGVLLMLQAIFMAVLAPVSGRLADKTPAHFIAGIGCVIIALGYIGLIFVDQSTSLFWIGFPLALTGIGMGLFSTPNNSAAMSAAPEEKLGIASALVNLARLMGQTMGTAIITLFMAIYIGKEQITVSHQIELQAVYNWVMGLSLVFVLMAAFYSLIKSRS